jgi:hypothetical protein
MPNLFKNGFSEFISIIGARSTNKRSTTAKIVITFSAYVLSGYLRTGFLFLQKISAICAQLSSVPLGGLFKQFSYSISSIGS